MTEAQVRSLAQQGQFAGVGIVSVGGSSGTGTAIAPGWVLTAKHFTGNGNRATFTLNGVNYTGTSVSRDNSDVALIRLDPNQQLPASTVFIAPNQNAPVVGELIWKVGRGRSGSLQDSRDGTLASSDAIQRAGTNIVNSRQAVANFGQSFIFNNSNTAANSTAYEVTTAPGDSGGPMFLQHNNQWFIAGTTFGAVSGIGFVDPDVAATYDWIVQTTGQTFAPQTAPTQLFWDGDFGAPGVQTGPGTWDNQRPMFTADGFNFTWENDAPLTAVFGTASTSASIVNVGSDIVFSEIRFAPLAAASGPFQIIDGGGTLTAITGGGTVDAQTFARLAARLVGTQTVSKTGAADLLINGDNAEFAGQFVIQEGTTIFDNAASFGVGGFLANTRTTVEDGATLRLRGAGITTGEHFRLTGEGHNGQGAMVIQTGQHIFNERIGLLGDATLRVEAGASATFGGEQGRFFNQRILTKVGGGVAVFDNTSNIAGLTITEGTAAGSGGIAGAVTVADGATLRPGDSASSAALGTFSTGNLDLQSGSLLWVDLDPEAGLADRLSVLGTLQIAGELAINLLSAPTLGDTLIIIDNDGSDAVLSGFSNTLSLTGNFGGQSYNFLVSHIAGTGNDVALIATAVPEPTSAILLASAGLVLLRRRGAAVPTRN